VFDTLVKQFVYELISDPRFPYRERLLPELAGRWATLSRRYEPYCPECLQTVMPADGFYVAVPELGYATPPTLGRATHVGINRERAVAEDALLFTQETVQPEGGVAFWARIVADSAYEDTLRAALAGEHVLGRGRSRGMGGVFVECLQFPKEPDIGLRLELLDAAMSRELERYGQHGAPGTFFTLTLRSEALLTRDGLPVSRPSPSELDLPQGTFRLRSWARMTAVGGWHSAAHLPYRTRQAVERGAVYLFHAPNGVDETALVDRLETLERTGIGDRRERGYGQLTVCAPFHYRLIAQTKQGEV
jgi:CRISPR-associated protein Csx10